MVRSRANQPCLCDGLPRESVPKKTGRTYLRPVPGTGVPSKERFQHAPCGAYIEAPSFDSKCQFWYGQQPKLREIKLVVGYR